jgi:hypothetical protein
MRCQSVVCTGMGLRRWLLYNSFMPSKRSLFAILEVFHQKITLLAERKVDLTTKDSLKPPSEQRLRKLQGSLKGSGSLQGLVHERQKEKG